MVGPLPATALALGLAMICVAAGAVRPTRAEPEVAEPANEISPEKPGTGRAPGFVVDERGRPVANASVTTVFRLPEDGRARNNGPRRFFPSSRSVEFMLTEEDLVALADGGRLMGLGKYVEPRKAGSVEPVQNRAQAEPRDEGARPRRWGSRWSRGRPWLPPDLTTTVTRRPMPAGRCCCAFRPMRKCGGSQGLKAGAGFDYFENYRSRPTDKMPEPLPGEVTIRLDGSHERSA